MTAEPSESLLKSVVRNAIGLSVFAFITAGVIGIVQYNTADTIAHNVAEAQAKALYEITPKTSVDNDLLSDTFHLASDEAKQNFKVSLLGPIDDEAEVHFARKNGKLHTFIFPVVAPDGYTTHIKMLVGIRVDGSIAGVRVVDHKETPGLGDKVELKKSNWILDFTGKYFGNPEQDQWSVKKDGGEFDQFTGATITPRAVVNAVRQTLEFYHAHQTALLQQAAENTSTVSSDAASTQSTASEEPAS